MRHLQKMKTTRPTTKLIVTITCVLAICSPLPGADDTGRARFLEYSQLADLPDALGVAGPFVGVDKDELGVYEDVLIVAGGANFAKPVWQSEK